MNSRQYEEFCGSRPYILKSLGQSEIHLLIEERKFHCIICQKDKAKKEKLNDAVKIFLVVGLSLKMKEGTTLLKLCAWI